MYVPFGYIEDREDGEGRVWKLTWQERLSLLENFVCDSGHQSPEDAEDEFWSHVNQCKARFMEKEFEEIPDQEWEDFELWVLQEN